MLFKACHIEYAASLICILCAVRVRMSLNFSASVICVEGIFGISVVENDEI